MKRARFFHRALARLAACLVVFVTVHAILTPAAAHGEQRYVELRSAVAANLHHDHAATICHSCPGHICLALHGTFDRGHTPILVPMAWSEGIIEPWPAADARAHPPTAPPPRSLVHFAALPRAPPVVI